MIVPLLIIKSPMFSIIFKLLQCYAIDHVVDVEAVHYLIEELKFFVRRLDHHLSQLRTISSHKMRLNVFVIGQVWHLDKKFCHPSHSYL